MELAKSADRWPRSRADTGRMECFLGDHGGTHDVTLHERRAIAQVGKQVTAEQRTGRLLEHHLGFPPVRDVWGRDYLYASTAEIEQIIVTDGPWWTVSKIVY